MLRLASQTVSAIKKKDKKKKLWKLIESIWAPRVKTSDAKVLVCPRCYHGRKLAMLAIWHAA